MEKEGPPHRAALIPSREKAREGQPVITGTFRYGSIRIPEGYKDSGFDVDLVLLVERKAFDRVVSAQTPKRAQVCNIGHFSSI